MDLEESNDGKSPTKYSMEEDGGRCPFSQVAVANSSMIYLLNNLSDVPPNARQTNDCELAGLLGPKE